MAYSDRYKIPEIHKKDKKQKPSHHREDRYSPPPIMDMILQRTIGNQEVQRMLREGEILTKLFVSQPGDVYEQEADRMARQILSMGDNEVLLKSEKTKIRKKGVSSGGGSVSSQTEAKINALKGEGQPLEPKIRDYFQPRFGVDLGDVRVHTDFNADRLARAIQARAFTLRNDVVFAKGEYQPGTQEGKQLVAHELTHVLQQHGRDLTRTAKSEAQSGKKIFRQQTPQTSTAIGWELGFDDTNYSFFATFQPGDTLYYLAGLYYGNRDHNRQYELAIEILDHNPQIPDEFSMSRYTAPGSRVNLPMALPGLTDEEYVFNISKQAGIYADYITNKYPATNLSNLINTDELALMMTGTHSDPNLNFWGRFVANENAQRFLLNLIQIDTNGSLILTDLENFLAGVEVYTPNQTDFNFGLRISLRSHLGQTSDADTFPGAGSSNTVAIGFGSVFVKPGYLSSPITKDNVGTLVHEVIHIMQMRGSDPLDGLNQRESWFYRYALDSTQYNINNPGADVGTVYHNNRFEREAYDIGDYLKSRAITTNWWI